MFFVAQLLGPFRRVGPVLCFIALGTSPPLIGATFDVTTTADAGPGSLRQTLLDANANPGMDTITFTLPEPGPYTINLESALPLITDSVQIDGTSQPGYAGQPIVELNGANAGTGAVGLFIVANNCSVRGLVINRFGDGIRMAFVNGNVIVGNFIGTDRTGKIALGNAFSGVVMEVSANNTIGGAAPGLRNLISGNKLVGVYIIDLTSTGNKVQGNFIGTDVDGRAALGNSTHGIDLHRAPDNLIGGTEPGAGNVISGNGNSGIYMFGDASLRNVVQGNLIGTDATGTLDLGNGLNGVSLLGGVSNLIGGVATEARNVISGNDGVGVFLEAGARGNLIQGNFIGTDSSGRADLSNRLSGVQMIAATNNVVGGVLAGARNVISGNGQSGLYLTNSAGNRIEGNLVGTDDTGTRSVRNAFNGVSLVHAARNTVGGTGAGAGNIISGNTGNGIYITGLSATANQVQGNFIGTDLTGTRALGNVASGVWISGAPSNVIGGPIEAARNVISANGSTNRLDGLDIEGSTATGNVVQGNFLGTDVSGTSRLANFYGVYLADTSGNVIGGTAPGAGNLVSANADTGIYLLRSTGNVVQGNLLGTDVSGTNALGNFNGVVLYNSASNLIGGTATGSGNLVSANSNTGIYLTNAMSNRVQGNRVGTQADGIRALGNSRHGIELLASSKNAIGGLGPGEGNIIAYATLPGFDGVRIRIDPATGNVIRGNSTFANAGLGIDLGVDGVTQNDARDPDAGANSLQNFPVLSLVTSAKATMIAGTLDSVPNSSLTLDFYASEECDPTGYGEGRTWLGTANARTDGNGNANFTVVLTDTSVAVSQRFITATASDANGNTSELSPCVEASVEASVGPSLRSSRLANALLLAWPMTAQGYALEVTESLSPPVLWTTLPAQGTVGGEFVVTNNFAANRRFYRLRK